MRQVHNHEDVADHIGKTYNRFTILEQRPTRRGHKRVWCQCSCGKTKEVNFSDVLKGYSKSCGCLKIEYNFKSVDITGRKIGKLTVIGLSKNIATTKSSGLLWECLCDCGNTKHIHTGLLTNKRNPVQSCGCLRKPDLTGQRFGKLIVTGKHQKSNKTTRFWDCNCDCGRKTTLATTKLLKGISQSCGCGVLECSQRKPDWRGHGEISDKYFWRVVTGAATRVLEFSITIEDAWNLFLEQNRLCALSGELLQFGPGKEQTASLDRIDSSKGYHLYNIQWIHKDLNKTKLAMPNQTFIDWCTKVADYQRSKNGNQ